MRAFEDYNPIVIFVYFLAVAGITMFCMNPLLLALSFAGAFLLFLGSHDRGRGKTLLFLLAFWLVMSVINPLFQHNGKTVLFILNQNRITLEACIYGMTAGLMIITVILWFRSFSKLMTSDRLLYVFAGLSPRFSLLLSMTLRYIPLFGKQLIRVEEAQKARGLYKEDNIIDNISGKTKVFSILVTWGLENGIITADSMEARGYGLRRRSFYSIYRFRKSDLRLLVVLLLFLAEEIAALALGWFKLEYYPELGRLNFSMPAVLSYIFFGITAVLPTLINFAEGIKWRYYQSKI